MVVCARQEQAPCRVPIGDQPVPQMPRARRHVSGVAETPRCVRCRARSSRRARCRAGTPTVRQVSREDQLVPQASREGASDPRSAVTRPGIAATSKATAAPTSAKMASPPE